ncbi:hypothetical protein BU25DRAFT_460458 [Macroventuria anomochaeta]|uniref:Uncharacterized protein n=1 Tax=Macroventuria anomochaeta TaxID=301207 RepID=A0ACB6RWS5_9PLEO|nr:uncharacterized protein BU25DRAFT_460458 [Macroventuria anomochaeta]KAF2625342.1 hypothetical protein BU25DRAFT_460458 [Macroventuria anomochaeta]
MTGSWHTVFTNWYRHRNRRPGSYESGSSTDIELGTCCRSPERFDSGISFGGLDLVSDDHVTPKSSIEPHLDDPILLKLKFGDQTYIKPLDYGTFSRWTAVERLMVDMEQDGIIIGELWDVVEKMRVCSGDWNARVRPGWDVHVHCQDARVILRTGQFEDDSDSEGLESDEEGWVDEVLDQYQEEWCLPRWRVRVEQERSINGQSQEPSWMVLGLGCVSMVFFIVAVVVYTA